MQLNQPIPPPASGGDNQYDFILSGGQKAKKGLLPQTNSRKKRILVAVAGVTVLFVIGITLYALIFGSSGSSKDLLPIAQSQTELIRVSGTGSQKARDLPAQIFAQTVSATLSTGQAQTVAFMSKGGKVNPKELALGQDPKTDAALKSADIAGRYDDELIIVLEKSLAAYRTQVSEAYKAAPTTAQKQLLKQLFDQVTILVKNQPAVTNS